VFAQAEGELVQRLRGELVGAVEQQHLYRRRQGPGVVECGGVWLSSGLRGGGARW
jgi:hypothetical protein